MGRRFSREEDANRPLDVPAPVFKPARKAPVLLELAEPKKPIPATTWWIAVGVVAVVILFAILAFTPPYHDGYRTAREQEIAKAYHERERELVAAGLKGNASYDQAEAEIKAKYGVDLDTIGEWNAHAAAVRAEIRKGR